MARDFQTIITSPSGVRRRFPSHYVAGVRFTKERYGGDTDFEIQTVLSLATDPLSNILYGDRVEFWYKGVRFYRGYLTGRTPAEDEPDKLVLTGYGASQKMGKLLCRQRFVFPNQGVDVGTAFSIFAKACLMGALNYGGGRLLSILDAQKVGITTGSLDAWQRLSSDVLTELIKLSGNTATWGCDVAPDGTDRGYFRPFAPTNPPTHVFPAPSRRSTSSQAEGQIADLVTSVFIIGGNPQYQQLLHNGDWNIPRLGADPTGSLVLNGDFGHGGFHVADNWAMNNGATVESGKSSPPAHVAGFSGPRYAELDNSGGTESCVQYLTGLTFTTGHNYTFSFRALKEIDTQVLSGHCLFELVNASGVTIFSISIPVVPPDDTWTYFSTTFLAIAGAAAFRCTFVLDSIAGQGGQQGGLCIDDVELYDADVGYQEGWDAQPQGPAAHVNAVNWLYQDKTLGSPYAVYLDVTALDLDGSDLDLRPPDGARASCTPGQQIRFSGYFNSPNDSINPYMPKFYMEIDWFSSDGNYLHRDRTLFNLAPGAVLSQWTEAEIIATAPSGASKFNVTVTFRGTGSAVVALLSARDAQAPAPTPTTYQPEGPVVFYIDSNSTLLPGGAVYAGADALYGSACAIVNEPSVLTQADAVTLANAFLGYSAVPMDKPTINRINDPVLYLPGDTVRFIGKIGPLLSAIVLPIVRANYVWDGTLQTTLEMSQELPDDTLAIRQIALQEIQRYGIGGANYGSGGAGGGGYNGNSVVGSTAASFLPKPKVWATVVPASAPWVINLPDTPYNGVAVMFDGGTVETEFTLVGNVVTLVYTPGPPSPGNQLVFYYWA